MIGVLFALLTLLGARAGQPVYGPPVPACRQIVLPVPSWPWDPCTPDALFPPTPTPLRGREA